MSKTIDRLQELQFIFNNPEVAERIVTTGAISLERQIKARVFVKGEDSGNVKIGNYSTSPITVGKGAFFKKSAFQPKAKHKTVTLPDGYKELRDIQGMRTDTVTLKYSGALRKSLDISVTSPNRAVIGFTSIESEVVANAQERRYGRPIFTPNPDELKQMRSAMFRKAKEIISNV
jgi:hypothetical protein